MGEVIGPVTLLQGDCGSIPLTDDSVDLVVCSPPYEDARWYGELGFKITGQAWVDWCMPRFLECLRVSRGLVAWVVEGKTRRFRWSATPVLLMAELHRLGVHLRKPAAFKRVGIPGSGGPDWLRNDYELIVCATRAGGRLAWSDNTACGHPPVYGPGGAMSNRTPGGKRVGNRDEFGCSGHGGRGRKQNGDHKKPKPLVMRSPNGLRGGDIAPNRTSPFPKIANPGNVIDCGSVGGNKLGHKLAHQNEAPFPLKLAEVFVRSFCPPGGVVLDPFAGSGTTAHAAIVAGEGRRAILMDIRADQLALSKRRVVDVMGAHGSDTQGGAANRSALACAPGSPGPGSGRADSGGGG